MCPTINYLNEFKASVVHQEVVFGIYINTFSNSCEVACFSIYLVKIVWIIIMSKKQNDDKLKALKMTIDKLEKSYGKGVVMKMDDDNIVKVDSISTGSLGLDIGLGVGGFPKGRVIEIYGPESSGKTTLAMHCIAEAQKKGGICAFVDAEHAFDKFYGEKIGIDTNELLISQPDDGEQALEIADNLIRSGAIDVIVIDSVAALVPRAELEGDMGDSKMGLHARLMSQALRKLTGTINKTGCICIFINQLREKIGVMFGNPETTTGGNALKFYASVRLDIRRIGSIKDGVDIIGNRVKVKVAKNKVAPPFRVVEFDIMYGQGISKVGEVIDLGVENNVIQKSGSWFSYDETRLGQGRDSVKQLLLDNPEMMDEIEGKIFKIINGDEDEVAQAVAE
jgi:recombination protein RecA